MVDCRRISKTDREENHPIDLDPVCARNRSAAKRAAQAAGEQRALEYINGRKQTLVDQMTSCGGGSCAQGLRCVAPTVDDVRARADTAYEAVLQDPQPDPIPCPEHEKLWDVKVLVTYQLTATCKCEQAGGKKKKKKVTKTTPEKRPGKRVAKRKSGKKMVA